VFYGFVVVCAKSNTKERHEMNAIVLVLAIGCAGQFGGTKVAGVLRGDGTTQGVYLDAQGNIVGFVNSSASLGGPAIAAARLSSPKSVKPPTDKIAAASGEQGRTADAKQAQRRARALSSRSARRARLGS
jgi:hypothetical protein